MAINEKVVLIVGGSGFLGGAIVQAASSSLKMFATHRSQSMFHSSIRFDLLRDDPRKLLRKINPEIDILAAHIEPLLKERSLRAGAKFFLHCCDCHRLVYISSDAVFDGRQGLYDEEDPISPVHDYGHGLAFMEAAVRRTCADHVVVRPSYLYGFSSGRLDSRLASTRTRLLEGQKVRLFDDMYKSPLEVNQAAGIILDIATMQFTDTVHVAGPRMSVFDFQRQGVQALGLPVDELITEKIPRDAALLRDTSLSFARMVRVTGKSPRPQFATLSKSNALSNDRRRQQ